jgi:hypothetical protein
MRPISWEIDALAHQNENIAFFTCIKTPPR